jgi:alginate O-acetyltransferase complex protein AlgI
VQRKFFKFLCFITSVFFTNVFVCFCWVFFRAENFHAASQIITGIFTWQNGVIQIYVWVIAAIVIVFTSTIAAVLASYKTKGSNYEVEINGFYPKLNLSKLWHLAVFFVVAGLIIGLAYTGANPFIYFQF